jgi:kynurenine formamidase
MPLEDFYTSAIALDLSHVQLKAAISVREMEEALAESGEEIGEGDTVLVYMAFNKRVAFDEPRWQHDFPGLHPEAVTWLADKGCKMFGECLRSFFFLVIGVMLTARLICAGVEAISPSPEGEMNFHAHNICGERKMTHMEGLDNLDRVVGKGRFTFVGFPLKLRGGSGSPIRAVALFD